MEGYRFFRIGADGHVVSAVTAECHDDQAALEAARAQLDGEHGIEIWQLSRRVAILSAEGATRVFEPQPRPPRRPSADDITGPED